MFNNFFPENRAVHKIMWKNMEQPEGPQLCNTVHVHCMLDI